jgi:hypothetical protein
MQRARARPPPFFRRNHRQRPGFVDREKAGLLRGESGARARTCAWDLAGADEFADNESDMVAAGARAHTPRFRARRHPQRHCFRCCSSQPPPSPPDPMGTRVQGLSKGQDFLPAPCLHFLNHGAKQVDAPARRPPQRTAPQPEPRHRPTICSLPRLAVRDPRRRAKLPLAARCRGSEQVHLLRHTGAGGRKRRRSGTEPATAPAAG